MGEASALCQRLPAVSISGGTAVPPVVGLYVHKGPGNLVNRPTHVHAFIHARTTRARTHACAHAHLHMVWVPCTLKLLLIVAFLVLGPRHREPEQNMATQKCWQPQHI